MLKFLAAKNNTSNGLTEVSEQNQFTRFANNQKRFTRFKTHKAPQPAHPEGAQPTTALRQDALPEMTRDKVVHRSQSAAVRNPVDERAHLYANNNVPVGILRKALPLRFAQLDGETDGIAVC